jgi:transcriptional regulator with XRE-family HTH domain
MSLPLGYTGVVVEMGSTNTFGAVLRRLRHSRALSQRHFGLKYGRLIGKPDGVAPSVIAGWEAGTSRASRQVIGRIASALAATPAEHDELLMAAGFMPERADGNLLERIDLAIGRCDQLSDQGRQQILEYVREVAEREATRNVDGGER